MVVFEDDLRNTVSRAQERLRRTISWPSYGKKGGGNESIAADYSRPGFSQWDASCRLRFSMPSCGTCYEAASAIGE